MPSQSVTSSLAADSSSEMLRPTSVACSPYDQPGMLVYDKDDTHANRWHPFAGMREDDSTRLANTSDPSSNTQDACAQPAPALAASFLRASWAAVPPSKEPSIGMGWAKAPLGPDGREWEDVEWARNRTIVHIGDSISRFKSKYICEVSTSTEEAAMNGWRDASSLRHHNASAAQVIVFSCHRLVHAF